MGFKYIIIDNGLSLQPVIFPDRLCHDDVARAICAAPGMIDGAKVISAGFIELDARICHGESETLELVASRGDASLINEFPYCHGLKFS